MNITPKLERVRQSQEAPGTRRTGRRITGPVRVQIEELVLHGFAPADRHTIARAVETELARLMGTGGGPGWRQGSPVLEQINGGAFQAGAGIQPQESGTQIAQAIYRGLRQSSVLTCPRSGNEVKPLGLRQPGQQPK